MNDMAKNLLLWVIIAVVLLTVFQSFNPRTPAPSEVAMPFTTFTTGRTVMACSLDCAASISGAVTVRASAHQLAAL